MKWSEEQKIQRMADRDLTHYDDVFDLIGIYYSNGFGRLPLSN